MGGLLVLLLVTAGSSDAPEWEDLLRQADAHRARGEAKEARALLERALPLAEAQHGQNARQVADVLAMQVTVLNDLGAPGEARPAAERALAIRERVLGTEHLDVAESLLGLGLTLQGEGVFADARPLLERSIRIREKLQGDDHLEVASVLSRFGLLLRDLGAYGEARPVLERALRIREARLGPDDAAVAESLNNLGLLLKTVGAYAEAEALYERALAINERALGAEHLDVATNLTNLAVLRVNMGSPSEARPLFERALAIREKKLDADHPLIARGCNNLATNLRQLAFYAEAKPLFERAVLMQERRLGPKHPDLAPTLNNLGSLLLVMGEYAEARRHLERSLAIREEVHGPDHPAVATALQSLAYLLYSMGALDEARPLYDRSLRIREKALGAEHPVVEQTLFSIGEILQDQGQREEAQRVYEQIRASQEKRLGPDHPDLAGVLDRLGTLKRSAGELAEARALHERAVRIHEKERGPAHPYVATSLHRLARTLAATGADDEARALLLRALAIREEQFGPTHPDVARTRMDLADLLARCGDRGAAFELTRQAEESAREHLRLMAAALPERLALGHGATLSGGLDRLLSLVGAEGGAATREAWDALVRARGVVLEEAAARLHVSRTEGPEVKVLRANFDSASQRLANLLVRGPENAPETYRTTIEEAQRAREQAEQALADRSAPYRRQRFGSRVGFEEVAHALPPNAALVAFALYDRISFSMEANPAEPSYLAFVLGAEGQPPVMVALGPAAAIDPLVDAWRREAGPQGASDSAYINASTALRRIVWDPVAVHLDGARRVFVVPDGGLGFVNFSALVAEDGRFLLEHEAVLHLLTTERDLLPRGDASSTGKGLLAVGGPEYDATSPFSKVRRSEGATVAALQPFRGTRSACGSFQSLRFEPLPESAREAEDVAALWARKGDGTPAQPLLGAAASESAFKANAPGKKVLHAATHGFFLGDTCPSTLEGGRAIAGLAVEEEKAPVVSLENPLLLSGLVLAGANHRDAAGPGEDDGILTAEEIAALDLSAVGWVVLSGCDTGLGKIRRGEGVFGLRRAFEVAGARTLILSLWSVDDRSTRHWMRALYEARFEDGLGSAEAVRAASLEVLRRQRKSRQSSHPFHWAAFVATGNWN